MQDAFSTLAAIREKKPLIHHITNWVTIYDCAAVTRAFGALPVMAHAREEAADMEKFASALVLNMGTLTPEIADAMAIAGKEANRRGTPVIFDAVGAGATPFRTSEARRILSEVKVDVLKGNPGEMAAIAGIKSEVRGVESVYAGAPPREICGRIVSRHGCAAVITGNQDTIVSKMNSYTVDNGHPLMGQVVGTGCMSASAIGAFCAVEKDYADAAASALVCTGIAGALAAARAGGPGTWKPLFFDEIAALDEKKVREMAKVQKI